MKAQWIENFFNTLNRIVWGPWTLFLFVLVGIFLTIRLRFFQFRKFGFALSETAGKIFAKKSESGKDITPIQAVSTALAGTIGTGSIVGVAMAIRSGGPGVIFWMWIFSFFGMAMKFSEIVLSLSFREKNEGGKWIGGPMYYMKNGLKSNFLAVLFSFFALFCCFGIGNIIQSNAVANMLKSNLNVPVKLSGFVLTIVLSVVILGGIQSIGRVNQFLVPLMTITYILTSLLILTLRSDFLLDAVLKIFQSAFSFRSATVGLLGYGFFKGVHFGISRSIFSNEAGLGSGPIAHAASAESNPVKQGYWGIFEVFFTTMIVCTLTALVLLTSDAWYIEDALAFQIVISAFDGAIPIFGRFVVCITTVFFALSSILGWAYYGEVCVCFLF
ncbi:MAG: sodium:alanine symporter family protein, partial [Clostridia bacterium]|nr:sodium:alanine symporter family protein [Clostridia bacterium]